MFGFGKTKPSINEVEIEELLTRGVENIFPNKEFIKTKLLRGEQVTLYLGIDPTGPTLHLGHLIPLLKLSKFQKLGHKIILLMGDFTAMIGDPTDKSAARKKLTQQEVLANLAEYKSQASKFISFSGQNKAELRFNSEWLSKLDFGEVLELTSLLTVDQMLKRDMFSVRQAEGKPIYIHEFLYPLMQGYDSVAMNVDGEVGGNDQTFNMLIGRDLLKALRNKEKFVLATKLLTDPSGKKMGKTEGDMVSLNQNPEEMFGKVMSWDDSLIVPGFEILSSVSLEELGLIKQSLQSGKNPKEFKISLAKTIVSLCYDQRAAEKAEESFENTFSKKMTPTDLSEIAVSKDTLLADVLFGEGIISSKTEWRRLVSEGAISDTETKQKVTDTDQRVFSTTYKIGKRRFIKIKVL